jgi:hypothetical protein
MIPAAVRATIPTSIAAATRGAIMPATASITAAMETASAAPTVEATTASAAVTTSSALRECRRRAEKCYRCNCREKKF